MTKYVSVFRLVLRFLLVARKDNLTGILTGLTGRSKNLDPTGNPTGRSTRPVPVDPTGFHLCSHYHPTNSTHFQKSTKKKKKLSRLGDFNCDSIAHQFAAQYPKNLRRFSSRRGFAMHWDSTNNTN